MCFMWAPLVTYFLIFFSTRPIGRFLKVEAVAHSHVSPNTVTGVK